MKKPALFIFSILQLTLLLHAQKKVKMEQQIMESEQIPVFLEIDQNKITYYPEEFNSGAVEASPGDYQLMLPTYIDLLNKAFGKDLFVQGDWNDIPQMEQYDGSPSYDWRSSDLDLAARITLTIYYDGSKNVKGPGILHPAPYSFDLFFAALVSFNDVDRPMNVRNFMVRAKGETSDAYEEVPELSKLVNELPPTQGIEATKSEFESKAKNFYERTKKKYDKMKK